VTASARQRREALVEVYREVAGCTRCPLHVTRTRPVFGAGNANADLVFVGEAPGAEEDRQGLPFVGRAGRLLTQLLEEVGMRRDDVFICNVLKSRPPGNRDPQPEEIEACWPYLERQIELIEPRVVATLGNFATKRVTRSPVGISRCCGVPQLHEIAGRTVFVFPLFHPAAALRTPATLERLRADFAKLPALLAQDPPGVERGEEPAGSPPGEPSARELAEQLDLLA
jgi:DNA polymerase